MSTFCHLECHIRIIATLIYPYSFILPSRFSLFSFQIYPLYDSVSRFLHTFFISRNVLTPPEFIFTLLQSFLAVPFVPLGTHAGKIVSKLAYAKLTTLRQVSFTKRFPLILNIPPPRSSLFLPLPGALLLNNVLSRSPLYFQFFWLSTLCSVFPPVFTRHPVSFSFIRIVTESLELSRFWPTQLLRSPVGSINPTYCKLLPLALNIPPPGSSLFFPLPGALLLDNVVLRSPLYFQFFWLSTLCAVFPPVITRHPVSLSSSESSLSP